VAGSAEWPLWGCVAWCSWDRWAHQVRREAHTGHTRGFAPGYVQGNVVIVPMLVTDVRNTLSDTF